MTDEEILRTWLRAFATEDNKRLAILTADGFQGQGETSEDVFDRDTFLRILEGLWRACPDWQVEVAAIHHKGQDLVAEVSIQGTHDEALDLSSVGLGWMPASGEQFEVSRCPISFAVENGRVVRERSGPDGLAGVLERLGLDPHA